MKAADMIAQGRDAFSTYWLARTEQERRFLGAGAAVVALALVYSVLLAPALDGRAKLSRALPEMRQQAATLRALALEAGELARQPVPQVATMSRESLTASLATRSIKPDSLTLTGEYAKLQITGVSFANLSAWLDAQRRESRIQVQDAAIVAQAAAGQVDATLTLRQSTGAP